jgi:hypothetical protein
MLEYREKAKQKALEGQSAPTVAVPGVGTGKMPSYISLAQQYGYNDDNMEFDGSSDAEQTLEQEYQAYVTAPLSTKYTDILKYWEVSNVISCAPDIDRL